MTTATAARMSDKGSKAAVATALTPYCLPNAKADPMAASVMAELKTGNSYQRRGKPRPGAGRNLPRRA